jgi:hypothetical protein
MSRGIGGGGGGGVGGGGGGPGGTTFPQVATRADAAKELDARTISGLYERAVEASYGELQSLCGGQPNACA